MSKCPRCFSHLPQAEFAFEALTGDTDVDPRSTAYRGGHPVTTGRISHYQSGPPTPEQVHADLGDSVVEVCPMCHYRLPSHWRNGNATCIAMGGARATGKTVYVAVMVKQLERLLERHGQEIVPVTQETERVFREVYEEGFRSARGMPAPTTGATAGGSYQHDPLVFSIGIWRGVREYLVIRDVAGEDLQAGADLSQGSTREAWTFFAAADAVIFMFDPLAVQEIRDHLRDIMVLGAEDTNKPKEALRTVMRLMNASPPEAKLAVVLSKFDSLQILSRVQHAAWGRIMGNAGAAFNRDPGQTLQPYDDEDGVRLHCEVNSLLQKLEAGPVLTGLRDPQTDRRFHGRFFAVSALGESPTSNRFDPMGFAAFRCMDPVRWVYAQRGIL